MRPLFFIFILFSVRLLAQQNPTVDSLTWVYNHTSSEKEKAELLAKLSASYRNIDTRKTRELAYQGIELSKKVGDTTSEILCVIQLALLDRDEGNFVSALSKLKGSLMKVQKGSNHIALSSCLVSIGDVYSVLENQDEAIKYYEQAIALNTKYYNRERLVAVINRKGNRLMDKGRKLNDTLLFIKAIEVYQQAQKVAEDKIDKQYVNTFISLADAYNILGQYTQSPHHLYESLKYSIQSMRLAKQIYSKEFEAVSYVNMGEVYLSLNKGVKAIHYFDIAEKIYVSVDNKGWILNTDALLGKTYFSLHLYDRAVEYTLKAIDMAILLKNKRYLQGNYQLLSEIYGRQGKYKEAFYYHKLYTDNMDSVTNEASAFNISRLQAELDLERKNNEIELLTKSTELQNHKIQSQNSLRNYLIIGICVLVILLAITFYLYIERRKGMLEVLKAKNLAEQAKEAQEQFLANTSHEIRTPMNGIIGMTNHLMETQLNPQQKDYVSIIKESSNNLLSLINELLDLSKIIAKKIVFESKEFDLREIIKGIARLMEFRTKEKNIQIVFDVDANIPNTIIGDPVRLKQIILNLVENAVKFTKDGEVRILVKLANETTDNVELLFNIEDTGIGIPESKLNVIFENFTQVNAKTTRKYSGTGLGLAITKQLIEQQDGSITVSSKINVGSVFSFNLKFKKVFSLTSDHTNHRFSFLAFPQADLSGFNVLVVDDNKINQQVAALTLKKWNVDATVATSAAEALDLLQQIKFDLVLMDVTMPEMDGFDATREIRKNPIPQIAKIPIVAITAAAFVGDKEKCLAAGMNDYISKPFNPEDLLKKLMVFLPGNKMIREMKNCDLTVLYERSAGDQNFIREILQTYIQEMPMYIAEMELFLDKMDWNEISKQAHKMKSPIALMGAAELKELYAKIEIEALSNSNKTDLVSLIRFAQKQCLHTVEELKMELVKVESAFKVN